MVISLCSEARVPTPARCKTQDLSGFLPPPPLPPSLAFRGFDEKERRDGGHERRTVEDKAGERRRKGNAATAMGVSR